MTVTVTVTAHSDTAGGSARSWACRAAPRQGVTGRTPVKVHRRRSRCRRRAAGPVVNAGRGPGAETRDAGRGHESQ